MNPISLWIDDWDYIASCIAIEGNEGQYIGEKKRQYTTLSVSDDLYSTLRLADNMNCSYRNVRYLSKSALIQRNPVRRNISLDRHMHVHQSLHFDSDVV